MPPAPVRTVTTKQQRETHTTKHPRPRDILKDEENLHVEFWAIVYDVTKKVEGKWTVTKRKQCKIYKDNFLFNFQAYFLVM